MTRVRLGISTCPNDTYAFHGLLTGEIEVPGVELDIELRDVQELNEGLAAGRYDVAKASYFAAAALADEILVFRHGSALGYGVGPVLLARPGWSDECDLDEARVLIPGMATTANLLFRFFHPECQNTRFRVFSEIMPGLVAREADLGVCIHEGRFSYQKQGLHLVEDLGARWELRMRGPLPLGGVFGRSEVDAGVLRALDEALGRSLALADADPAATLPTMRKHAQEFDDEVLMKHVELYVGEATRGLDDPSWEAINFLQTAAKDTGLISGDIGDLRRLEVGRLR